MNASRDSFPFTDVGAEVLRMTPAVHVPEPDEEGYGGVFAYNRDARPNIERAITPYLERAKTEEERIWIRADMTEFEQTLRDGFEDIDDIFYIADRVLADNQIDASRHEGILRRSSRLVIAASRLDNTQLGNLKQAAKTQKSLGDIRDGDVQPPMEIFGAEDSASLSWSRGLLQWMKSVKTRGCPARSAVIEAEGQKRQTVMQLMWDRAVTAQYGDETARA